MQVGFYVDAEAEVGEQRKGLLGSNIYEKKRWRRRIGQGELPDHDTDPIKSSLAQYRPWEQRWFIREVPH